MENSTKIKVSNPRQGKHPTLNGLPRRIAKMERKTREVKGWSFDGLETVTRRLTDELLFGLEKFKVCDQSKTKVFSYPAYPYLTSMIRLAITDDSGPVRENLKRILGHFPDLDIVWTAADGDEAVKKIASLRPLPEVVLMDIEMRRMDGVEATRQIHAMAPQIRIIMLTIFEEEDHIFNAIRAGAAGYLLKDERPARLHQGILDAHEARMPMSPLVAAKALEVLRNTTATVDRSSPADRSSPEDYQLTAREVEILAPLAKGKTYSEIATSLFISPNTVRRHIENIYRKLAVNSKVEASNLVNKHKWFE